MLYFTLCSFCVADDKKVDNHVDYRLFRDYVPNYGGKYRLPGHKLSNGNYRINPKTTKISGVVYKLKG